MPYLCWAFLYTSTGVNSYEKTILAQILQVLDLYAADMRKQFEALHEKFDSLQRQVQALNEKTDEMDKRIEEMDGRFERQIAQLERTVNERFERLEAKLGHIRVEPVETQETVDFHSVKIAQHDRKIRHLLHAR
ncbi:hypothetical protein [Geobacillus stearothermophilus]|uniref:Uncharacterized protein n=2 Tax=Anoxybacillaceae TaxID=3120669 RepID=A0A3L7DG87_GEOSE|nr:hypothetical protein [Geobacillus stearothermophilus]MBR2517670.1 hypothetical protein [Geobacillus sp.]KMY56765.1 hypothetical protein AA906_15570 [Geobacillus stearothermophilus]KMY57890.1 hypothetical protein AA904_13115 [Geobacillus stearothermophilus]KMY61985.1 hypothetical protein AA905_07695 [Geobacillus stearothermophilus]RLP96872.1 hypothetical protein D9545_15120 [Geobacillus stearothermophilus]